MKSNRVEWLWLCVSIVGFCLMALSFLLMPLERDTYFSGVLFWLGLLGGVVSQVVLDSRRKAFFKACHANYKKMQKPRCGALTFFANLPAKLADIALAVCAVGAVVSILLTRALGYSCYVFIGLTALMLALHCIFNGRNFFFTLNKSKIYTILEDKKKLKRAKERGRNDEK